MTEQHDAGTARTVDVPASATLAGTLHTFGRVCDFPDYYGANLDALLDCLRDQPSLRVTLSDADVLRQSDPDGYRRLVEVLQQARSDVEGFHFAISR